MVGRALPKWFFAFAKAFVATLLVMAIASPGLTSTIGPFYSSRVDATVTLEGSQYRYSFEVFNTTVGAAQFQGIPVIMDWELPLFSLDDIIPSSITSPEGWRHELVAHPMPPSFWNYRADEDPLLDPGQGGDPNLYGPNPHVFENPPYVLHWFTEEPEQYGIYPEESLSGFGFLSNYLPFNAPYLASWVDLPPRGGDPPIPGNAFGTPLSPARLGAQQFLIPEPSSAALLVLGTVLLAAGWRCRRSSSLG